MSSFDNIAGSYDQARVIPNDAYSRLRRRLTSSGIVRMTDTVADVGCGTGRFLVLFADICHKIVGIDISSPMLSVAADKVSEISNAYVTLGDATNLNVEDESYDVTVSSKLLIHLPNWRNAVSEMCRITKKGGFFVYVNESGFFNNAVRFTRLSAV